MEHMAADEALALACQQGDREAFGVLYDRYIERIYRFVYAKTFSKETAEDIVSGVFLRAYERIQSFDAQKGNVAQWLYGSARNAVIDYYRTRKSHTDIEDIYDLGEHERTEEKLDARNTLKNIEQYMGTLSGRQREIVFLRVWEERSYEEIATLVGGSPSSVKMMFSRTIRDIRTQFKETTPTLIAAIIAHQLLLF